MFKERPLRWIDEAEARQMLIHALSEKSAPTLAYGDDDSEMPANWLIRVRRWVFPIRSVEAGC